MADTAPPVNDGNWVVSSCEIPECSEIGCCADKSCHRYSKNPIYVYIIQWNAIIFIYPTKDKKANKNINI